MSRLLAAAERALPILKANLASLLESHCLLDPITHEPRRDTIEPEEEPFFQEREAVIAELEAAIEEFQPAGGPNSPSCGRPADGAPPVDPAGPAAGTTRAGLAVSDQAALRTGRVFMDAVKEAWSYGELPDRVTVTLKPDDKTRLAFRPLSGARP